MAEAELGLFVNPEREVDGGTGAAPLVLWPWPGEGRVREITGDGSTRPEGGRRKKSEAVVCNRGLL